MSDLYMDAHLLATEADSPEMREKLELLGGGHIPSSSGAHAPLPPSSAEQWGRCSAWRIATENDINLETEATREGTAAHWVMAETLEAFKRGTTVACVAFEGQQAPNGVIVDDKMTEGAQIMVDSVLSTWQRWAGQGDLSIEQRVYMPRIHENNWGTLDASLYVPEHRVLYIWDYKHGHRDCQAEGNLQLVDYLLGLVERYEIDGITDQQTTVVARIVQPFCYSARGPVKDWVFKLSDLRGYWNRLATKAAESYGPNPTHTTGRWCRDCTAVGRCSAARMAGYNFVDVVNEPYQMDEMTGADLAVERSILRDGLAVAKARLEAIEDELQHRLRNGETDSGLALESGQGREQWTIPVPQVITLCGQLGVDARKEAVKTPKQTRDSAPKEIRPMLETVMATVTRRPPGKLQLVQAENTKAARAFQQRK